MTEGCGEYEYDWMTMGGAGERDDWMMGGDEERLSLLRDLDRLLSRQMMCGGGRREVTTGGGAPLPRLRD